MIFNDYYVYFHRRKDNNVVFYIGKGNAWKLAVDYRNSMIEKNKELRNETFN